MDNTYLNKTLYKLFLIAIKYIPLIIAMVFVTSITCNYFGYSVPLLSYFGGACYIFIGLLYLISFVFKFCILHRIPLHYVTIGNVFGILTKYCSFSLSTLTMFRIYFILTGIMAIVYIWFMYKNRNKPKVDPIKQLCESYFKCHKQI